MAQNNKKIPGKVENIKIELLIICFLCLIVALLNCFVKKHWLTQKKENRNLNDLSVY